MPVPVGVWLDIRMRFGTTDPEVVVDGVSGTTGCTVGSTTDGIDGNANPWVFGARSTGSGEGVALPTVSHMRSGAIDHILIRDRRASASTPEVTAFVLVDAIADVNLGPLAEGDVIDLAALPTTRVAVRANTDPGTVGSVVFDIDGVSGAQTENGAPYSSHGDMGSDYSRWDPAVGMHTITATAYTGSGGGGTAGPSRTITFEVR